MARRLSAPEMALWSRVAASVRPLPGRIAPPLPAAPPRIEPAPHVSVPPPRPHRTLQTPRHAPPPVAAATLDGSWDRRLRQGDIRPDRVVDLHGHTLDAAHGVLAMALDSALANGERIILVITGKGRGDRPGRIKAEINHWLDAGHLRSRIAAFRPAHPRHGGSGAWYLILRRRS